MDEDDDADAARRRFYRNSKPWRRLRRQKRIEANHTCMRCGRQASGRQLHAHHIAPLRQYPTRALDRYNIKMLCRDCHRREHEGDKGCTIDGTPRDRAHPWNRGGAC